jgi:NifU-like protein involved in Fe-S cluster formation
MNDNDSTIYREALLRLARDLEFRGPLHDAQRRGRAVNPLCGDELVAEATFDAHERITALHFTVRGCAIAQASARLLAELARGHERACLSRWRAQLQAALAARDVALPAELESLTPLLVLRGRTSRHACALLAWQGVSELWLAEREPC